MRPLISLALACVLVLDVAACPEDIAPRIVSLLGFGTAEAAEQQNSGGTQTGKWRSWDEVRDDPRFKALDNDHQELARQQYFRDVVAPRVQDPADIPEAARQFEAYSEPGILSRAGHAISQAFSPPGAPPADRIAAVVVFVVVLLMSAVFGWFCWHLWKRLKLLRADGRLPSPARSIWLLAACVCLGMLIYPPHRRTSGWGATEGAGYSWLWSPPHGSLISVDYPLLLTEWVGVVVISALLWLFLRSK